MTVQVVVGHTNPDFDAYASMVAATKLYPGAKGVFLGSQNANVRAFHNLHEDFLDLIDLKMVDLDTITGVIMVDTRDPDRTGELASVIRRPDVEVIVYDHHPAQEGDVEGADDRSENVGATTSILVHEIRARGLELAPLEASLMLLGIHEDTGSLTFPGATAYDADAVAFLMASGADIEVLNQFLARTLDEAQQRLLAQLERNLQVWDVNGQQVAVGWAEAEQYVDSASVLTHYIVEDMGYRVAIAVVRMPERVQVVARSRLSEVDVGSVMARLGGGGHEQAASAAFRDLPVPEALERVRQALDEVVAAPLRARDIMSAPVRSVSPEETMGHAGELMARWGHGGVPVIEDGRLVGMITRKDVDKAVRHRLDHAPVTGFMGRDPLTVAPDTDVADVERLLATRGFGRLPVMDGDTMVGIVTRKDVLRAEHGDAYLDRRAAIAHPKATAAFLAGVRSLLPEAVSSAIDRLGELADERGVRAHVVGGFVRDMILARRNLDVDVVVEGDGIAFAEYVAEHMGLKVKVHRRFGTAVLVFPDGFHVDVASSRTEYYLKPGALPTVERSSLRQDLFRRDFTINAMAACISPTCFGQIADPFGGLGDIESRRIRVLHGLSFVDDPTRVLRSARFEARYGFRMDAGTEQQARHAVDAGLLSDVSGARVREEIVDILTEADPVRALSRLAELGALDALAPAGSSGRALPDAIADALAAFERFGPRMVHRPPRRLTTALAAWAAAGSVDGATRWVRHFRIARQHSEAALALATRAEPVLEMVCGHDELRDSRLYHLLAALPPETVVNLWARANGLGRARIERFETVVVAVTPAVTGRDLMEMGIEPSEVYSDILARARDARLDGIAVGREAELAHLRKLAEKAGAPASG